jgi:hypothetical protein
MGVFASLVLLLGLLALLLFASRAREVCVLSVRRGRLMVMRGALPPAVFEALADVVERSAVARGTIQILRDGERGRVQASGLDSHAEQRVRNVIGTYPLVRLLAGARAPSPNLGQRLGLAWLAWHIRERREARRSG